MLIRNFGHLWERRYVSWGRAERVNDFETPGCINLVSKNQGFS